MGMTLLIESEPELRCPNAFPDTDSKGFASILFGPEVEVLARGLGLDLAPLKYAATDTSPAAEEMIREDWGEEAEEVIAQARRTSELAWHTPDTFLDCLGRLAELLERNGRRLPAAVCRAIDPSGHYRSYLQGGDFTSDVAGCLAAIRSLKEQGARRVRFFAF